MEKKNCSALFNPPHPREIHGWRSLGALDHVCRKGNTANFNRTVLKLIFFASWGNILRSFPKLHLFRRWSELQRAHGLTEITGQRTDIDKQACLTVTPKGSLHQLR